MMAAGRKDYYQVLGVSREADAEEIKRAYRRLAMQYHPDRNVGDPEAEQKFKEATEAYEILREPDKRQIYDRYGHAGLEGGNAPNFHDPRSVFNDLFGDILGSFFGHGGRAGPERGRDLRLDIELDLAEAAKGVQRDVSVEREELCSDCRGSGSLAGSRKAECRRCGGRGVVVHSQGFFRIQQSCSTCGGSGTIITNPCTTCGGNGRSRVRRQLRVTIPAGVDSGTAIRLGGEGEAGDPGAPRGDLYCVCRVKDHTLFHRDGQHLICQVPITFSQAALGTEIEVPTLNGPILHSIPPGTQSGQVVRIPGQGMPSLRGGRSGDLLVQVTVETPRRLSKRQEELLRELAELDEKHVSPERKGFLEKVRAFFSGDKAE